jgi:hypothetical protein
VLLNISDSRVWNRYRKAPLSYRGALSRLGGRVRNWWTAGERTMLVHTFASRLGYGVLLLRRKAFVRALNYGRRRRLCAFH